MSYLTTSQKNFVNYWLKLFRENNIPQKINDSLFIWIYKNNDLIYQGLKKKYENKGTLRNQINTLSKIFKNLGAKKLYDKYSKISSELKNEINEEYDKQVKSKQNIDYKSILIVRDKFCSSSADISNDLRTNLQNLILNLYTRQPPIRLDYLDMKLINRKKVAEYTENCLYVDKNKKIHLVIQRDKVSKSHDLLNIIIDKKLEKIIFDSFYYFPRKYLLCSLRNIDKPMSVNTFNRILEEPFNKKITVDHIRSAYISHFYDMNPNLIEKQKLAILMRHSVQTAERFYRKVKNNTDFDDKLQFMMGDSEE